MTGLAGTERRIVGAIVMQLDAHTLIEVQAVKEAIEAGRLTGLEAQIDLAELQAIMAEIHRRTTELPAAVAAQLAQIAELTTGPQLDVQHKLVAWKCRLFHSY